MNTLQSRETVKAEVDRLTVEFFRSVSFDPGEMPSYEHLHALFIEQGLLIKNVGPVPEVSSVAAFIDPRQASVHAGDLTRFKEWELSERTEVFGNVAHRFSAYGKSGTLNGSSFNTRGMISTQFVRTAVGWRISSMAWDDERQGLTLPVES
jgi:hypothetical protein